MTVFGIETATMTGGIGIVRDGILLAELRLNIKTTHSERLLPGLDYLMRAAGMKLADMDAVAVSIGPGSFTGLRVGLGMAKGISFALEKPVIPVPTLEAMAWNLPFSAYPVVPLFDARKKELYGAVFEWDEEKKGFERLIPESVMPPLSWAEAILKTVKKAVLAGEGALLYGDEFRKVLKDKVIFAEGGKLLPSPANIAFLGEKWLKEGLPFERDASKIKPFYIRKSEAELKAGIL